MGAAGSAGTDGPGRAGGETGLANLRRKRRAAPPGRGLLAAVALALACGVAGCSGGGQTALGALERVLASGRPASGGLDEDTIVAGLREALQVSTDAAVRLTSARDGFLANEAIRIRLPESLEPMTDALRAVGFGGPVDRLDVAMNRAAERAAGEATAVFLDAIRRMTFSDARGILQGGETAATEYFRRSSSEDLRERFEPIVAEKVQTVGLAQLYSGMVRRYEMLPVPDKRPAPELEGYVTDRTLDGLFTVLGEEETRIRRDPSARASELLRTVFGS